MLSPPRRRHTAIVLHGLKEELLRNRRRAHNLRRQGRNTTATAARGGPVLGSMDTGQHARRSQLRRRSASLGETVEDGPSEALCVPDLSTYAYAAAECPPPCLPPATPPRPLRPCPRGGYGSPHSPHSPYPLPTEACFVLAARLLSQSFDARRASAWHRAIVARPARGCLRRPPPPRQPCGCRPPIARGRRANLSSDFRGFELRRHQPAGQQRVAHAVRCHRHAIHTRAPCRLLRPPMQPYSPRPFVARRARQCAQRAAAP